MFRLIPAPLHRVALRIAYRLRHRWRMWRRVELAGVSVIVKDLRGQLLVVRHSYGPQVWGLPGGGLNKGEDPESAARRELLEEVGITAERMKPLGTIEETVSGSPHTAYLFEATVIEGAVPDCREVVEARFFPPHSLPEPLGAFTRTRLAHWREVSNIRK